MVHIPVNKETLGNKRLKPLTSFEFLAKFPVCEIVIGEFSAAGANFPIFFVERDGSFSPIAMLSLLEGDNMFVEPDGQWTGHYMPAAFRRYPFSVGPGDNAEQTGPILMVEDSMLSDSEGELMFPAQEGDEPNSPLGRVLRLIAETDRHHQMTRALIAELKEAGLINPSDLTVEIEGQKHNIGGLFGIDEKKLQELPDEAFLKLRKSGALTLAHIQLQSVGQIQRLILRHRLREEAKRTGQKPTIPLD